MTPVGQTLYTRLGDHRTFEVTRLVSLTQLTYLDITNLGAIPAASSTYRSFSTPLGSGSSGGTTGYAFLGLVAGSGSGAASVAMSFSNPSQAIGHSFESLYPGISEAALADAILVGGTSLQGYLDVLVQSGNFGTAIDSPSGLVHFSDGVAAGTALVSFSPIPEPGTALVCLGALGVGCFTRRRPAVA